MHSFVRTFTVHVIHFHFPFWIPMIPYMCAERLYNCYIKLVCGLIIKDINVQYMPCTSFYKRQTCSPISPEICTRCLPNCVKQPPSRWTTTCEMPFKLPGQASILQAYKSCSRSIYPVNVQPMLFFSARFIRRFPFILWEIVRHNERFHIL